MKKWGKINAFTLIEAVVTLAIVIAITTIPSTEVASLKRSVEREQAVKVFKGELERAKKQALLTNQSAQISYYKASRKITVSQSGKNYLLMRLPVNMRVDGLDTGLVIKRNGFIAPKTIVFRDASWSKKLTIQMMWGEIVEN